MPDNGGVMRAPRPPLWVLLPVPYLASSLFYISRGSRRWEHIALVVVAPLLTFAGGRARRMLVLLYPLGLVGLLYDAMGFVKNAGLTPERVHVCDLYALERAAFGVGAGAARVTLPEWFQQHASTLLDVYCAVPYAIFLFAYIGYAVYLYFRDQRAMRRLAWAFLFLNVVGFATYHLVPAAPPWYWATHGCAVDLSAQASVGPNLARVDALLGV